MLGGEVLGGDGIRQWRPSTAVRLVGGWIAIAGCSVLGSSLAAWIRGDLGPAVAAVSVVAGALVGWLGYGALHRYRITLGGGLLTIVGVWCTYRIPVQHVVGARATRPGVLFALSNGGRALACAVAAPAARADEAVDAVLAAAATERALQDLADGARPYARASLRIPAPPPPVVATIGLWGRITSRNPRGTVIRYALCWLVLAAVYGAFFVVQDGHATSSASAAKAPQLKVGDCLSDSTDPRTVTPCSLPHTGQVFMVADYTPGIVCDKSKLDRRRLPADASYAVMTVWNGTSRTSCLVVTSAITWSVVKS